MTITVMNHLTLDGIAQAPGRPDEDRRGGFDHGGWAQERSADPVVMDALGERMAGGGGLLLGRRTYDDFHAFWPTQPDNPFSGILAQTEKVVCTRTADPDDLDWDNTTPLVGEAIETIAALRDERPDEDFGIMGSLDLATSLSAAHLVDEYLLMVHPITLGAGRRQFGPDGPALDLDLVHTAHGPTGVVAMAYRDPQAGR